MADSKTQLRKRARERRKALAFAGLADALAAHAGTLAVKPGMVVGGYRALPDEADPAALLAALAARGCIIALPRVAARDQALVFHAIPADGQLSNALVKGPHGILEPPAHWPRAVPALLLVPLLAFDGAGHRLGYGGGFYDRTLAKMPGARAVGIAHADQQVDFLPHDAHDWPLDAVLTGQGLKVFR